MGQVDAVAGRRVRHAVQARKWSIAGGLTLAMLAAADGAAADPKYACFPPAVGVFGLDGPPDWSDAGVAAHAIGAQLDDPRWNGSLRDDLPQFGGMTAPEAAFRGVQDGTNLYMSFQAVVDPNGTTASYDAIYLGFGPNGAAGTGKIIRVTLNGDGVSRSTDFTSSSWHRAAGSWSTSPFPAWAQEIRVWTGTGTGTAPAKWAVNVRVNVATLHADADIGGLVTDPVRMFYALDINTHVAPPPAVSTTIVFPLGTVFDMSTGTPGSTMDPTAWGTMLVGTSDASCPVGVSLIPEHIGTMPISVMGIPSTTVEYAGGAGHFNTFVAVMDNPPPVNSVKARFRLADWGTTIGDSTADWKDIIPTGGAVPQNSDGTHPERITWQCEETTGATNSCPGLPNPTAPRDQCMLVDLSSLGGITPVHFAQDSARRNLDFVHASKFDRDARISVNGLAPLGGGGGNRDVYLYVKTTNMPASIDGGKSPPPPDQGKGPLPSPGRAAGQREKGPAVYEKTVFEQLQASFPTYEVHVYHDTGRKTQVGATTVNVLEPQVPFGYLVEHTGTLDGWKHKLEGVGVVLEEISPNFYHVKVPDNGAVKVRTTIEALECRRILGIFKCCCNVVRPVSSSPGALTMLGLGGLLLVIRVRGRRREPSR
jgi:hypothetical protein